MSYNYETQKESLFTEAGNRLFVAFRDRTLDLLKQSGAVRMLELMHFTGDGWDLIACADRMVELGDMRELTGQEVAGQHRVFVAGEGFLLDRECPKCRGTGHAHACSNCGIIDKINDGSCAMCDADIPVRPDTK